MDRSVAFYRDVLGLKYQGELLMEGEATEKMFCREGCKARVAYLVGSRQLQGPQVELIQFVPSDVEEQPMDLFRTCISELCFVTEDIWALYRKLLDSGVEVFSEPQPFDFTESGFGKSLALYFRDPDGIILELMQPC